MTQVYRYELHAHTKEVSRCSLISAVDLVRVYKDLGFHGVCITDHFLNGNTVVSRQLPWEEQVAAFCQGYELAYQEGKKLGIDVYFGWEYSYWGSDFLTFGLDKEWLLAHPEIMQMSLKQYCDFVRAQGGYIVHAHPFREDEWIEMIRLIPRHVDAVEVVNICRKDFENQMAYQYAQNYGLAMCAGSDNHEGKLPRLCGVELDHRVDSIQALLGAIIKGEAKIFVQNT